MKDKLTQPPALSEILEGELLKEVEKILESKDLSASETWCFPHNFKERFRSLSNILINMVQGHKEILGLCDKLYAEFICILSTLAYLVNCYSFEKGEYKSFDRNEIDRKLRR